MTATANLVDILEQLEDAWQTGSPPALGEFLARAQSAGHTATPPDHREVLGELVRIDLEHRWRNTGLEDSVFPAQPLLGDYLLQFPELGPELPLDLILDEYRVRMRWGDRPSHAHYRDRFPALADALSESLPRLDDELAAEPLRPASSTVELMAGDSQLHPPRLRKYDSDTPLPKIPGYEILEVLGRGGMGIVYKARQLGLNRIVAVKMVDPGRMASSGEVVRLRREAEAVARCQHPNIIDIHAIGEVNGCLFLVLEYVSGGNLAVRLTSAGMPAAAAAALVETLARAVQEAHAHGILHRDLKPANILLSHDGTVKITDFGLAKHLDSDAGQTHSGEVLGTPNYMSPEQACGKLQEIGPQTDVYALGVILYELLTGRQPFKGDSVLDTLDKVRFETPALPSRLRPGVPAGYNAICMKCLEKQPQRRYPSALALAEDLKRLGEGRGPERPSPRPGQHRRYWLGAALAGIVPVLALLAVYGFRPEPVTNTTPTTTTNTITNTITGEMNIHFWTRLPPEQKKYEDEYKFDIKVRAGTDEEVVYLGTIFRRERGRGQPPEKLRIAGFRMIAYPLDSSSRPVQEQRRILGTVSGEVPISLDGLHDFTRLIWTAAGRDQPFGGKVHSKSRPNEPKEPIEFQGLQFPAMQALGLPSTTLQGELVYIRENDLNVYRANDLKINYGNTVDYIEGDITWDELEDRYTNRTGEKRDYVVNAKGQYMFDLKFNTQATKEGRDAAGRPREGNRNAGNHPNGSRLNGAIKYFDDGPLAPDGKGMKPHKSHIEFDLSANDLTSNQIHTFLKMWLFVSGEVNDE